MLKTYPGAEKINQDINYLAFPKNIMAQQNRYSEKELKEFGDTLQKLLTYNKETLALLNERINEETNDTDNTLKSKACLEDMVTEVFRDEVRSKIEKQKEYIVALNFALIRVSNGSYGVCFNTGGLIPKERLKACPTATRIIKEF